jgi:F-type H+-transporting ATPase subunit gamma
MAELRELQRRLESIRGLRDVVNAMRSLAAVYVRRAEATLGAIRPYADAVNAALRLVLDRSDIGRTEPPDDASALVVVFASDQGLAGTFNERIVATADEFRRTASGALTFVAIGLRGRNLLILRGTEPVMSERAPTSLEGIKARVPELAARIFDVYQDCGAQQVFFIFNAFESLGRFQEQVRRIVPPVRDDLADDADRTFTYEPILTAPPAELLGYLIEEYFFIELYRSLLESHASENGARLTSMTAAASNVDERLEDIKQKFQSVRQETITAELMDVVSGAEALRDSKPRR